MQYNGIASVVNEFGPRFLTEVGLAVETTGPNPEDNRPMIASLALLRTVIIF